MRAADTNVLVRLLTRDDPEQVAAAEEFIRPGAWVSHLVLAELAWVLDSAYGVRSRAIGEAIGLLLEHESIAIQDPDVVREALEGFLRRPAVEFSDHLILAVARRAGHLPLGTFDRGLGKLEGAQSI